MGNLIEGILKSRHNIKEIMKKDFKSTYTNPIVILLLIAVIILPSLYGLVNIYACWNPYENTDHVQFAIANDDKGATYDDYTIKAGNDLVIMLKNNTDFDWVFVTSDELRQGVHDGKYYAGMVVPANFSESIVSITTDDPHSATLEYYVNEKYPVAAKLSDAAAKAVYNNINAEIVTFINLAAYDKLGDLQSGLASGASQMSSGASLLSSGASQVSSGASQVSDGAEQLSSGAQQLSDGADQLADGASQVAEGTQQAYDKVNTYNTGIHEATSTVKNYSSSATINDLMDRIDSTSDNVTGKVGQLNNGAGQVANGSASLAQNTGKLKTGVNELSEGTLSLAAGAELLANSAASALLTASSSLSVAANSLSDVTGLNETQVGDYIYAPVKLDQHKEFDSNSYGSQVAPFYIVLSMWVGALINTVLLKTGTSIGTKYRPQEMYFGKLLIFNIIAFLQTTVTLIGSFGLGIDIQNPILFIISCYFVSIIFMVIIYSLISLFGDVGKGIAIILLVFQISGTGGIYPVEIMHKIFGIMSPYLPMTHAITLVRESQLGLIWNNYLPSLAILLVVGVVVMIVSLVLKHRFDKHTKFFDEKLEESGLFN